MKPSSMKYNPAFLGDEALIESFVARRAELERILEVIRENTADSNQHLLVIGPRGIGKTTLVLRSAAEIRTEPALRERWYPIVFGEETYLAGTPAEFWLEALFHVGEQTGDARWRDAYEELRAERDEERLRRRALGQLMDFADERGLRLVLVVENLNMLFREQLGGDGAWVLRQTLMNEPRLMLLGTATSRFQEMEEYNEALYELFRTFELDPLDEAEAEALWSSITGQGTTSTQIRPLQILTGGNPRLIRILSEFAANTSFRSLMDDLTRLVDEHTEYFKHHLDNLPSQERKVFVALADLWDPSTARTVAEAARLDVNVTSALLKRLVERGAVTTPYKRGRAQFYQVAERMYNIYHLMRRRGPAASRVHAVVRFMVSLYRDEDLVRTTRSLVEEAARLERDQRREHFLAYEAILSHTREPRLANRLVEAARFAFEAMPDVPHSVQQIIGLKQAKESTQVAEISDEVLLTLRVGELEEPELLLRIATVLSQEPDRLREAEMAFHKTLALDPGNATAWHQFGIFWGLQALDDRALEAFDRVLALRTEDAIAWMNRGTTLSSLGRDEEALASYNRALELGFVAKTLRATRNDGSGKIEAKSNSVDHALAYLWSMKGGLLFNLNRLEEALAAFDTALELNAEDASSWFGRGEILDALNRVEEALESTGRALALDPDDAYAWSMQGSRLGQLKRYKEAMHTLGHALSLNAENAFAWFTRGKVLAEIRRLDEALESFDTALALDAEDADVWFERGELLDELNRVEEALESTDRALALNPDHAYAWSMQGSRLDELGRYEEAIEALDRALALDVEDAFAWSVRGDALKSLGRLEEALESHNRALEIEPGNGMLLLSRGAIYRGMHRLEEAESDIRQVISLGLHVDLAVASLVELLLTEFRRPEQALMVMEENFEHLSDSAETLNSIAWDFFRYGRKKDLELAEAWALRAVEKSPQSGDYRHTLACLLGVRGEWGSALEQAMIFLSDPSMLEEDLEEVIGFFVDAVAAGYSNKVLAVIQSSGTTEVLEPLVVAIQRLSGTDVDVAREILEVANDVIAKIEARRQEIAKA